jgi:hypothetical protein
MHKDDIIRMARGADLLTTTEPNGYQVWMPDNLEHFANLVAAAEREACAQLLLSTDLSGLSPDYALQNLIANLLANYAAAIRARGQ